jgi:hypothetical protein
MKSFEYPDRNSDQSKSKGNRRNSRNSFGVIDSPERSKQASASENP